MLTKIESLRKEKNKTQDEIAKHLGITRQTFSKLEKGNVEPTLGQAIKLAEILGVDMEIFLPNNMLINKDVLKTNTEELNKNQDNEVNILNNIKELKKVKVEKSINIDDVKNINNVKSFDYEKYKQVIQFFIENGTQNGYSITKSKLEKLCYLADFGYYYYNSKSITGFEYRKLKQGPVTDIFFIILDEMEQEEKISIEKQGKSYLIKNLFYPILDKLDLEEKVFLMKISRKWKDKDNQTISDFVFNQLPFNMTEDKEIISYEFIKKEDVNNIN